VEERAAAAAAVQAARADPARFAVAAAPDGSTYRYDSHAVQQELAGQNWPGRWIHVAAERDGAGIPRAGEWNPMGATRPPELNEFYAQAVSRTAVIGHMTPGEGKDATWMAMEARAIESREQAKADAIRIEREMAAWPPTSRIYFGAPDASEDTGWD
jgi:hypothetical protein